MIAFTSQSTCPPPLRQLANERRGGALPGGICALLALVFLGCATPLELAQKGRLREAYSRASKSDAETQRQVARALILAEEPSFEVRVSALPSPPWRR